MGRAVWRWTITYPKTQNQHSSYTALNIVPPFGTAWPLVCCGAYTWYVILRPEMLTSAQQVPGVHVLHTPLLSSVLLPLRCPLFLECSTMVGFFTRAKESHSLVPGEFVLVVVVVALAPSATGALFFSPLAVPVELAGNNTNGELSDWGGTRLCVGTSFFFFFFGVLALLGVLALSNPTNVCLAGR